MSGTRKVLGKYGGLVRGCDKPGCLKPWPCERHGVATVGGGTPPIPLYQAHQACKACGYHVCGCGAYSEGRWMPIGRWPLSTYIRVTVDGNVVPSVHEADGTVRIPRQTSSKFSIVAIEYH